MSVVTDFGIDSLQAILPDALRVDVNLFRTDLCRNPGSRMDRSLPSMALDTRFQAGRTTILLVLKQLYNQDFI